MRRKDDKKFQEVEKAIRLADKGFSEEAAIICQINKIPLEVAIRVITKPSKRRKKTRVF